jgi:hypothetical protein
MVVNASSLSQLFSIESAAWAAVAMLGVALFAAWPRIMERRNERLRDRATIEGDQYARMDARLKRLEVREEECQAKLADALGRLAEVEGFMSGQGMARQDAARIVAVERLTDRNGDKEGGGK